MSLQKRILVIEDSAGHREILVEALSVLNFEVKCLSNGLQILELIEKFQPDLLLIDYILPLQNGISISRSLKMNNRTSGIPILLMSAYCLESGKPVYADDFVSKPIDLYLLEQKIRSLIERVSTKVFTNDTRHFSKGKRY